MLNFREKKIIISLNWDGDEGAEKNLNFHEFLKRIKVEDPRITKWMNKNQLKQTSDIQNLMLKVNISHFLEIHKTYFPSELTIN